MIALPKEKIDFSVLHSMATAPIRAKLLMAGIELGIFDELGEIADAMLRCGFRSVRSCTIQAPMGEMDLDIACK
jgi:hypothetical protein